MIVSTPKNEKRVINKMKKENVMDYFEIASSCKTPTGASTINQLLSNKFNLNNPNILEITNKVASIEDEKVINNIFGEYNLNEKEINLNTKQLIKTLKD